VGSLLPFPYAIILSCTSGSTHKYYIHLFDFHRKYRKTTVSSRPLAAPCDKPAELGFMPRQRAVLCPIRIGGENPLYRISLSRLIESASVLLRFRSTVETRSRSLVDQALAFIPMSPSPPRWFTALLEIFRENPHQNGTFEQK